MLRLTLLYFAVITSLTAVRSMGATPDAAPRPIFVNPLGCNATALAQIPGSAEHFIGRQPLTADGRIAGITGPNDCSGGNPDNESTGKVFNRWALTLSSFDWSKHRLILLKPLLDTSIDSLTGKSNATITGGPMTGAVIRSAYDPDVVFFRGEYLVCFECVLDNEERYGIEGVSSCVSVYEPVRQALDMSRTQVVISGSRMTTDNLVAAGVPELLAYKNRLFIYWSALEIEHGKFSRISIRGAELDSDHGSVRVKGTSNIIVHALDEPATIRVWAPDGADPQSNNTADLRAVWSTGDGVVAAASLGGRGCVTPSDHGSKGCFRLAIAKSSQPLAKDVFNRGTRVDARVLPSNPQEYTRPVRDTAGAYWLIGHFIRPESYDASEHPMPDLAFWRQYTADSVFLIFPLTDKSLWPQDNPRN